MCGEDLKAGRKKKMEKKRKGIGTLRPKRKISK